MLKLWPFLFIFSLNAAVFNFKNDPFFKASKILETNFDSLPQSSEISGMLGSDWMWPIKEGGILNRWALKTPKRPSDKYLFGFFSYENLKNVDLAQLSPPEKFDLYLGNSDWRFSKKVKNAQATLRDSEFKTQLAFSENVLKFKNPSPIILEGKSSLKIPFGSSDISALTFASLLLDENSESKIIGAPCKINFLKTSDSEKCEGLNPGTFHILLSNYIGIRGKGLVVDLKRDKTLELRPVVGFVSNFKTIKGVPNSKVFKELLVTTIIKFIRPASAKWSFNPTASSRGYESYTYILELNEKNQIIGGSWVSFARPDFVALKNSKVFQGEFSELDLIYKKATALVLGGELKLNGHAQKEIIIDSISKNGPSEIISQMFEEYFENYKNHLLQKKSVKKFARAKLSREIKLSKENIFQKIKSVPLFPPFKKLTTKFIQTAQSKNDLKELQSIQNNLIEHTRRNYTNLDLKNLGKVAYLQQKYIDDFFETKKTDYYRYDYLERSYLLEKNIFSENEILTANKNFLEGAATFLSGVTKQRDELKSNITGKLKTNKFIPNLKDTPKSELVSAFITDVKANIEKNKMRQNNNWKKFLAEEKTIEKNLIPYPNLENEFKNYKNPRNYPTLKGLYRLSFSLKRIQALRKVLNIPVYNTLKDKTDYYLQKFTIESKQPKIRDLFKPYSNLEGSALCIDCFIGAPLKNESEKINSINQKEVDQYNKAGNLLISAIKKNDIKTIEELLKLNNFSIYQTSEGLNSFLSAVLGGNGTIITKIMEDLGNAINFEDKNGKNALTLGIERKIDQEILKQMVLKGIDFNARDNLGFFPRDYLKRTNSLDQFLEAQGAKLSRP